MRWLLILLIALGGCGGSGDSFTPEEDFFECMDKCYGYLPADEVSSLHVEICFHNCQLSCYRDCVGDSCIPKHECVDWCKQDCAKPCIEDCPDIDSYPNEHHECREACYVPCLPDCEAGCPIPDSADCPNIRYTDCHESICVF